MSNPIGGSRPQHPLTQDQQGLDRQQKPVPTVSAMALLTPEQLAQLQKDLEIFSREDRVAAMALLTLTPEQLAQIAQLQKDLEIFSREDSHISALRSSINRVSAMTLQAFYRAHPAERPSPLTPEQLAQIARIQEGVEILSHEGSRISDLISSINRPFYP